MGLFEFFKQDNVVLENNPNFALKLFDTLSVSSSNDLTNNEKKKINEIVSSCKERQEILNKVIEICGQPQTPKQRYIYAIVYAWSNKEYRKKAIQYINLYLDNPLYDDIYLNRFSYLNEPNESRKNNHLVTMYNYLGEIYEKEYMFNDSLETYNKSILLNPYDPISYRKKVGVLIKMDKIDDAITFLNETKNSKYYSKNNHYIPNDWFIKTINELIDDCEEKKKNNYKYKPRKQNINYV